jgi:hypothetical protein
MMMNACIEVHCMALCIALQCIALCIALQVRRTCTARRTPCDDDDELGQADQYLSQSDA